MTAAEEIRDIVAEHMVSGSPISDALLAVAAGLEEQDEFKQSVVRALGAVTVALERMHGVTTFTVEPLP